MKSEVRNLNIAVELLRIEISNAKPQLPGTSDAKATNSVIGFSITQATHSNESVSRNGTYSFDEPVILTPLSPPPRHKPVTRARSAATL